MLRQIVLGPQFQNLPFLKLRLMASEKSNKFKQFFGFARVKLHLIKSFMHPFLKLEKYTTPLHPTLQHTCNIYTGCNY